MLQIIKDVISLFFYVVSFLCPQNKEAVLVYHCVSVLESKGDPFKLSIHPKLFEKQMVYLAKLQKKRPVLVTFDDGFENFFSNAFSLVLRYNFRVSLFVSTDFINGNISFDHLFSGKTKLNPLTWAQLKEISDSGIEIGSHTITHPNLATLNDKELYRQIADSKKIIEERIGREVKCFAYPYGAKRTFNRRTIQIVRESGYKEAYTNIMGFNTNSADAYNLKRIRIYSNDNMFRFKMKLSGAYNWVDRIASFRDAKCLKTKI